MPDAARCVPTKYIWFKGENRSPSFSVVLPSNISIMELERIL